MTEEKACLRWGYWNGDLNNEKDAAISGCREKPSKLKKQ